jgi:hypothetical protein
MRNSPVYGVDIAKPHIGGMDMFSPPPTVKPPLLANPPRKTLGLTLQSSPLATAPMLAAPEGEDVWSPPAGESEAMDLPLRERGKKAKTAKTVAKTTKMRRDESSEEDTSSEEDDVGATRVSLRDAMGGRVQVVVNVNICSCGKKACK